MEISPPHDAPRLETKYQPLRIAEDVSAGRIQGYASIFGLTDDGGDVVAPGAFSVSLRQRGTGVKLLWQHDPGQPIGVWERLHEDERGLYVTGRLLPEVQRGAEAVALLGAGAIDGLSIGYRAVRSEKMPGGGRRLLEIDLWEVSLVTFPMLGAARAATRQSHDDLRAAKELADALRIARNAFK